LINHLQGAGTTTDASTHAYGSESDGGTGAGESKKQSALVLLPGIRRAEGTAARRPAATKGKDPERRRREASEAAALRVAAAAEAITANLSA